MHKYILTLLSVLLLASCCDEEDVIKKTAYKYSYAMANYDVDAAEKYATDETCTTTLVQARFYVSKINHDYIESDTPAKIEITKVNIVDDTTAYTIYHKTTPIKNFSDTLWMRKRDGRWKAHAVIPVISVNADSAQPNS